MAEHRPLVLVFEDLHWADDELLDFVDHLVEWAGAVPILIVCTSRPELLERRPAWGGGKLNATTLSLAPLSEADTSRLLGESPRATASPRRRRQIFLPARAGTLSMPSSTPRCFSRDPALPTCRYRNLFRE